MDRLCFILLLTLFSGQKFATASDISVSGKLTLLDGTVLNNLGSENPATYQSELQKNLEYALDFAKNTRSYNVSGITDFKFDEATSMATIMIRSEGNAEDAKENVLFALDKFARYATTYQFSPDEQVLVGAIKKSNGANLGIRVFGSIVKRDPSIEEDLNTGLEKMINYAVQRYEGFKQLEAMSFKHEVYENSNWTKMELRWPQQFPPQLNLNELFSNVTAGKPNNLGQYYFKGPVTVEEADKSSLYLTGQLKQWNEEPITAKVPDETLKTELLKYLRVAILYRSYVFQGVTNVEIIENNINSVKIKVSFNFGLSIYLPNLKEATWRLTEGIQLFDKYESNIHFATEPVVELKQRPTGFDVKGVVERRMGSLEGDVNEEILRDLEKSVQKSIRTVFYFRWFRRIHVHCKSLGGRNAECKVDWDIPNDRDVKDMLFGLMCGDTGVNGPFGAYILRDVEISA